MKILTLDIGGTSIKSAVFENGGLIDFRETFSNAGLGGPYLMEQAQQLTRAYQKCHRFDRIGISTAGQVDPFLGCITFANENIPDYTGMPVQKLFESAFGIPVRIDNDVHCAALGERYFGVAKDVDSFICLTYGTGIGGAFFVDGKLVYGSSFAAGQFGALLVHPEHADFHGDFYDCGYEKYASTLALVQMAQHYDSALTDGKRIFSRLEEPGVREIVDCWIDEVVLGLRSIIHILNPAMVILGGGIMEQPYLSSEIRRRLIPFLIPTCRNVRICSASLGNRAGLFGAAALWLSSD